MRRARWDLRVASRDLARVLGRRGPRELEAKGELRNTPPGPTPDTVRLSLQTPAYRRAYMDWRATAGDLKVAWRAFWPEVSASGGLGRAGDRWPPREKTWRARLDVFFRGRTPVFRALPHRWHDTPNVHFLSLKDFETFCREKGIRVLDFRAGGSRGPVRFLPNLLAEAAVYRITSGPGSAL